MPVTHESLKSDTVSNISARWPFPLTDPMQQLIDAYADGLARALYISLSGSSFAVGTVTGGAAPPSGPVVGAMLSYAPGSFISPSLDLDSVFVPPSFTARVTKSSTETIEVSGEYTAWLRCFTNTLSQAAKTAWSLFASTWAMPGFACVGGGAANWVASTPPVPGPWLAGTITAPFQFVSPATGTSVYVWDLFADDFALACETASVTIQIQSSDPITTPLLVEEHFRSIARAVAGGFADTVKSTVSTVTVYDPTGSGGTGTALPGGVITPGVLAGAMLNMLA